MVDYLFSHNFWLRRQKFHQNLFIQSAFSLESEHKTKFKLIIYNAIFTSGISRNFSYSSVINFCDSILIFTVKLV